jgi:hypothetical protein
MAYGHSAVQPDLGASLRTYQGEQGVFDNGVIGPVLDLATLGNPNLKPERSTEFEGGADMRFLLDRVTLSVTGYHKLSRDALVSLERPLSVGGGMVTTNLGSVRNSGGDVEIEALVLDHPDFRWNVNTTYSWNRNTLVRLAPAFNRAYVAAGGGAFLYGSRYVEGYPVNGTWMRPVVAYADTNGDGFLTSSEIVRSDSSVFVGGPLPKYDASFGTQIGLWHDRMTIAATMQYQNGKSEVNQALLNNMIFGTARIAPLNDSTTPLSEQAAYRSGYAAIHTVSTLRLQSLSVRWAAPTELARRLFHAEAISIALQGSNLGLWTNYAGSDPNVSDTILGNAVSDSGVLPQPRTWGINVSLNY